MTSLELITVEFDESHLLPEITPAITDLTGLDTIVRTGITSISEFYSPERGQYDGGKVIEKLEPAIKTQKAIIYTSVDLYIPIFTFVFGLAKLNGKLGIVSTSRLKPEFYGLPRDEQHLKERLIKETIHELGHLFNLRHCANYYCVMTSSNTADDLDVKSTQYCTVCMRILEGYNN